MRNLAKCDAGAATAIKTSPGRLQAIKAQIRGEIAVMQGVMGFPTCVKMTSLVRPTRRSPAGSLRCASVNPEYPVAVPGTRL